METTTSLVLHGARDLRLENRPLPPPPAHHVQISVLATGLCGSDLHYYAHARNGAFALQAPLVLGHESAGIITAVGPGVVDLQPGQHVAIEAGIPCETCEWCTSNRYNLCSGMRFRSSAKTFPHLDGTMQSKINHPAKHVYALPDGVTCEKGALAEPLSVLLHASRRAGLGTRPDQRILIFGAGVALSSITMVDINQERLSFAKDRGLVGSIFCLPPPVPVKGVEALDRTRVQAEEFGHENDIVFECTGAEACIQMAVYCEDWRKVLLIGMGSQNVLIPISNAATREVDILGSFRYADTYKEALQLLAGSTLPSITEVITHRVPLTTESVKRAFESMVKGKDENGKLVIKVIVGTE
ncbi:chaperonin 10-like protein [Mucidula mucida]|nr:chaperonin 10-like protein [Mucidula mucida]